MNLNSSRYLTPVLTILLLAVGAFEAATTDGDFSVVEQLQLLALFIGACVTYAVPLLPGIWPAALKVAGAVLGAALATIIGAVSSGVVFNPNLWSVIILSGLNALAAQVGSDARVSHAASVIADPNTANSTVRAADPRAFAAAESREARQSNLNP